MIMPILNANSPRPSSIQKTSGHNNNTEMAQNSLVLVTGASGYLGSHCVKLLLERGYRVRGTVRSLKNAYKVDPIRRLDPSSERLQLTEADLLKKETWPTAVSGCDYVLHVASPFPMKGTQATIDTAVNGTINVLRACSDESSVRKVVLTSSIAAIAEGHRDVPLLDESYWTNLDSTKVAYLRSKTIAEKAAWDMMKEEGLKNRFKLTVINPSLIVGPPIVDEKGSSVEIVSQLMSAPLNVRLQLPSIDVRDVAMAHVEAMERPESDGQRIICSEKSGYFMAELCAKLREEFGEQGYSPPSYTLPDFLIHFAALFSSRAKVVSVRLGMETKYDNTKLQSLLSVTPRDTVESIISMVYHLIERGHIKKTAGYKGIPEKYRV